jgi:two-component system cell cycle response regulator DivK
VAKRVLVVEDNELNLKLFCDLLRDVVAQALDFRPDLVITDIHLPHVSGLDLIISMKRDPRLASVPIMAVTAYAGKGDEDRIRGAGAQAYVSKPISVLRFIEQVNALL